MKLPMIFHKILIKLSKSIIRDKGSFTRKYRLSMWISDKIHPNVKDPFHGDFERILEPEELNYFRNMNTRVLIFNILYIIEKIVIITVIFILGRLSTRLF